MHLREKNCPSTYHKPKTDFLISGKHTGLRKRAGSGKHAGVLESVTKPMILVLTKIASKKRTVNC
jgi:hypothetical protein